MPAPIDLTGRRFGRLVVLAPAGHVQFGNRMRAWRCRCDCGVTITVPRVRLPYYRSIRQDFIVDACPACRRGRACKVCGTPFVPASSRSLTCSDACRDDLRRQNMRSAAKKRRDAETPATARTRNARYRARVAADQERYARKLDGQRNWYERNADTVNARRRKERMADPEKYRNQARATHAKARLAALLRIGEELEKRK